MNIKHLKSKLGARRTKNVLHISLRDGYVYVSNPKAGSSSIKLYLARCEKRDHTYTPKSLFRRKDLPFIALEQMTEEDRERIYSGNFFVFTFVRHPLKRAVSAYCDKILGNQPQKKEILSGLGRDPEDIESHVTFDEFVSVITSQKPSQLNPHWRPQVLNLYPDVIDYHFIGRLESFDHDFGFIRNKLGLPVFETDRRNVKSSNTDKRQYLSLRNRFKLARLYAQDFIFFGYRLKGIERLGVAMAGNPSQSRSVIKDCSTGSDS